MLYAELIQTLMKTQSNKELQNYRALLTAVVANGAVDDKERHFIQEHQAALQVSEQEHLLILSELGWTREGWERGSMDPHHQVLHVQRSLPLPISSGSPSSGVEQLRQ